MSKDELKVQLESDLRSSRLEEEIRDKLLKEWYPHTIEIWRRARYKCEYCSKLLIDHPDDYFHNSNIDHIVPGAGDDLCNLALACRPCNNIKRARNPLKAGEVWPSNDPVLRSDLIARARNQIDQRRAEGRRQMEREVELLRKLDEISPLRNPEVAPPSVDAHDLNPTSL